MTAISNSGVALPLEVSDPYFDEDVQNAIQRASIGWMKNEDVLCILESFQVQRSDWPTAAATQPAGDGRTVKETHEKLKVADQEKLNCYYAHADSKDGLQRRCYWILDDSKADIVLVHYLCATTSRAGGTRGSNSASSLENGGNLATTRPRREAAQRARRFTHVTETDEDDPSSMNHKDSGQTTTSSDYVPSNDAASDLVGAATEADILLQSLPNIPGGSGPNSNVSLPSLQQMHAQYTTTTGGTTNGSGAGGARSGAATVDGGGGRGTTTGAGRKIDEAVSGQQQQRLPPHAMAAATGTMNTTTNTNNGGGVLETAGASMDGLLVTQMSLGSAGDSQLIGLVAGAGNLDGTFTLSESGLLGTRQMSQDGSMSMRAIHREFAEEPGSMTMIPEFTGSIPRESWRRITGLEPTNVDAALLSVGQGPRSIKFSSRMEDSPLMAGVGGGGGNDLGSDDMRDKPSGSGLSDFLIDTNNPSSGAMSIKQGEADEDAAAAVAAVDGGGGGTTSGDDSKSGATQQQGFVVGRVQELVQQPEGVSPGTATGNNRSPGNNGTPTDESGFTRRANPTAALVRPSAADRSAAAATAAAKVTHEHRELQLQKARQARLVSPYEMGDPTTDNAAGAGVDDDDGGEEDGGLIDNPNSLFRMTSHMVTTRTWLPGSGGNNDGGEPEQTTGLLKLMSIDEAAAQAELAAIARDDLAREEGGDGGLLMSSVPPIAEQQQQRAMQPMSVLPGVAEEGPKTGTTNTSEATDPKVESRKPSISSLLESMKLPETTTAVAAGGDGNGGDDPTGDALRAAMARHAANAEAKRAGRGT